MRLAVAIALCGWVGCSASHENGKTTGTTGNTGNTGTTGSTTSTTGTTGSGGNDLGGGTDGSAGGGGSSMFEGLTMPWPVFDGKVPDVPTATGGGKTWYADANNGSDNNDGTSLATAKKTFGAALQLAKAGDTVLLAGGIYRERPDFSNVTGAMGKPITIGSYGHGTGAPILDGGEQSTAWTNVSGTVWKTSTTMLPNVTRAGAVLGIYVNTGTAEYALREVAHGQIAQYANEPTPSGQNQKDVTDNSNQWYYDTSAKTLYADFGGTLGSASPNGADVSILYNSQMIGHEPLILLFQNHDYFSFIGLTIRAGSWHGVYTNSKGNTFDKCDVKFNGGGGIFFDTTGGDPTITGNQVTHTRIWMNVLDNWPRFNNGNSFGGWPGALSWYSQSNALSQGNVVYQNGGEGTILWGTTVQNGTAHVSMNNHVLQNVVFDNWSMNIYCDNTQGGTIEQNFVFDHPRDDSQTFPGLFAGSEGYNTDSGRALMPVLLGLADEPGSADDNHAHLSDMTVINNIFVGGEAGFIDYDDGTSAPFHGLRNCLIANNTWVLGTYRVPQQTGYGWKHLSPDGNPDNSSNSIVQNNIIVTANMDDDFVLAGKDGAGPGIDDDYNVYSGPGTWMVGATPMDYTAWKAAHTSWDQHSVLGDAALTDITEFSKVASDAAVYDWSKAVPTSTSAAWGAGKDLSAKITTDFAGKKRASGSFDTGAVLKP